MWRIVLSILIVVLPSAQAESDQSLQPIAPQEFSRTLKYGSGWEKIQTLSEDQALKLARSAGIALRLEFIARFSKSEGVSYFDRSVKDVPNQLPLVALKTLSAAQARELSNFAGNGILLWSLKKLGVEPARELARYRGDWIQAELDLSGLEKLGPKVSEALSGFRGARLKLNGLRKLGPSAARQLASFRGDELYLDGLTQISFESLRSLAGFKGNRLSLNGITHLTTLHARALGAFSGKTIRLASVSALDDSEVRELLNFEGERVDRCQTNYTLTV